MQFLILIFVNGVVQNPASFIHSMVEHLSNLQNHQIKVIMWLYFSLGTDNVDVTFVDANESVKFGDEVQLLKNSDISNEDQNRRVIAGIVTSDLIETNVYFEEGINSQVSKPLRWIKQKTDKFINGELVTKVRPLIEPLIFPESKIIKDFSTSDQDFYLDSIGLGTDSSTTQFF